jgi:hypothetical protein
MSFLKVPDYFVKQVMETTFNLRKTLLFLNCSIKVLSVSLNNLMRTIRSCLECMKNSWKNFIFWIIDRAVKILQYHDKRWCDILTAVKIIDFPLFVALNTGSFQPEFATDFYRKLPQGDWKFPESELFLILNKFQ